MNFEVSNIAAMSKEDKKQLLNYKFNWYATIQVDLRDDRYRKKRVRLLYDPRVWKNYIHENALAGMDFWDCVPDHDLHRPTMRADIMCNEYFDMINARFMVVDKESNDVPRQIKLPKLKSEIFKLYFDSIIDHDWHPAADRALLKIENHGKLVTVDGILGRETGIQFTLYRRVNQILDSKFGYINGPLGHILTIQRLE